MALIGRWCHFKRVIKSSNNHFLTKAPPSLSSRSIVESWKVWLHTEHAATENASTNEKANDERPNFIEAPISHDYVMSHLLKCSSLREQLITLPSLLSLTPDDLKQRQAIGDMVCDMLKPFFHVCKIHLFGSSANGFGFKGCDIDMALDTGFDYNETRASANDDSEIPTMEDVLSGKVSKLYMSKLSATDRLLFIHTVFLDHYKESIVTPIFISAYVPLIRFYHDFHQMKVDLTCSNRLALVNTKLLHLYGQMDSRVKPLVMAVRYWAKNADLVGGGLMFNSYCLSLLMIFFLQRRNPPVLPTFEQVCNLSDSIMSLDMSDKSYMELLSKIPPSSNTESIDTLLREFFFFYFYYDFEDVICTRNAQTVSRSEFSGEEYSKKFRFNTICVQDPIKLTHNVANLVDFKHCRKFAYEMLHACHLFQGKSVSSPGLWGLAALFENKRNPNSEELFDMKLPLDWVAEKRHHLAGEQLLLKTAEMVTHILKEALLFNVYKEQETDNQGFANSLLEGTPVLFSSNKVSITNNTWLGRSNLKNDELPVEFLENPIDFEKSISLILCERFKKLKSSNQRRADDRKCDFEFYSQFYALKENGKLFLYIKFIPSKRTHFNPVLSVFLNEFIPKLMKKLV